MKDLFLEGFKIEHGLIDDNSYIQNIKAINSINEFFFNSPITFFVGENGSGKSTLLEAIAESYGFNSEGGTKNNNFKTYDETNDLLSAITLYKGYKKPNYNYFFRAETFFNVATKEEEYSIQDRIPEYYHKESHGEGFIHLFKNMSNARGLFLMDEPEAALSIARQLTLFSLIYEAAKKGSQFIIVTHSPILLAIPDADIFELNDSINKIDYEDTDSYKITSSFINHKDIMINELIKNNE